MIFRWKVLGAFRFRKHEVFSGIDEVKAGGCGCMQVVVGMSSHASDLQVTWRMIDYLTTNADITIILHR